MASPLQSDNENAHGTYAQTLAQTYRALCEFRIEGLATNKRLLQSLLRDADVQANAVHTQFLDVKLADLAAGNSEAHPALHATSVATPDLTPATSFLDELPDDAEVLTAPMDGALIQIHAEAGAMVARGDVPDAGHRRHGAAHHHAGGGLEAGAAEQHLAE